MKIEAVRKFALSLPDVVEQPHFQYASFRVGGRIFVTVPPEGNRIHVFVDEVDREPALACHPEFIEKLWWGKSVCGLRIQLAPAPTAVVKALVQQAWNTKRPTPRVRAGTERAQPGRARVARPGPRKR